MPKVSQEKVNSVWRGPEVDGITFSLLSRWLVCRERFRLYAVEGLRPADQFNHRLEFGSMWHICEESLAKQWQSGKGTGIQIWPVPLKEYVKTLCRKYSTSQEQIVHWMRICEVQFPLYVQWWKDHPDVIGRTPLLQEVSFSVPYKLPSGRTVRLLGKWDSVDLIDGKIYLQENKTKGDVNEQQLRTQIASGFDLQTMLYIVALRQGIEDYATNGAHPVAGVRYNVIRRPLSGGRGTIVRHKGGKNKPEETPAQYYARLASVIAGAHGMEWDLPLGQHHFFKRWKIEILPKDVERFQRETLNPILEDLYRWWDFICFRGTGNAFGDPGGGRHFRYPFGVFNSLLEGGSSDLDDYLATGSELGLERTTNLFPELT